jgi:ADP-ribose pyrophosphatase
MSEQIIAREQVYGGRLIQVEQVTVQDDDGQVRRRDVVRHPGAVAVVGMIDGDILLVRQYRVAADRALLELPAGTLDPDEAPEACAEREMQEETGYRPGQLERLGGIYVAPGYTTEYIHLFLATDLGESRLAMDDDERIEVVRLPLAEVLAMIDRGELHDGKTIAAVLLLARRIGG